MAKSKQDNRRLICWYCHTEVDRQQEIKGLPKHIEQYLMNHQWVSERPFMNKKTTVGFKHHIKNVEKQFISNKLEVLFKEIQLYSREMKWACKNCMKNGKYAKLNFYNIGYLSEIPYLVFLDEVKKCHCGNYFVFSMTQKIYLYEKIVLSPAVVRTKCSSCRIRRNLNKYIDEVRSVDDENDPESLVKQAHIYYRANLYKKSKLLFNRAKNIFKKREYKNVRGNSHD